MGRDLPRVDKSCDCILIDIADQFFIQITAVIALTLTIRKNNKTILYLCST